MIVLSGASGFVGRRLALRAKSKYGSADLTCLVWDSPHAYEQQGQAFLGRAGVSFLPVDLVTGQGLSRLARRPKIVYHLAANTFTATRDHRCNDLGTQHLIQALGPLGPDCHVLFTSSVAVMDHRSEYSQPLTEETPLYSTPCTPYGRSKLRAEEWLRDRAEKEGFSLTILRLVTVYGSGPRPTSIFYELQKQVRAGALLTRVNWPGLTGFVHADDAVEALERLSERPPPPGASETYLVQTEAQALATVSAWLHRALDIPYRPVSLPPIFWRIGSWVGRRKKWLEKALPLRLYNLLWRGSLLVDHVFWCQTDKLAQALPGWKPRLLEQTIHETLEPME